VTSHESYYSDTINKDGAGKIETTRRALRKQGKQWCMGRMEVKENST